MFGRLSTIAFFLSLVLMAAIGLNTRSTDMVQADADASPDGLGHAPMATT